MHVQLLLLSEEYQISFRINKMVNNSQFKKKSKSIYWLCKVFDVYSINGFCVLSTLNFDKDGCVCLGCNLPSTAPNSIFTTRSRINCYIECKLTNNGTKMHQCYYSLIDGSCSRTRTFQILIFGISNPSNSITCSKATNEIVFVLYQRLVKYN